ncbi:oxygenase MpaB family protein [Streptomyces tremellae]|uniref:oxygenase MpaB family protein n=1 Tax=Streptomyces tremellae TaxID=1124239 RepID=UPI0031E7E032
MCGTDPLPALLMLAAVPAGRAGTLGWGTRTLEVLVGLRERIAAELTAATHGGDLQLERYAGPPGDPGLFGIVPGDPVWRVHGQATGMLAGGFAALMLQSLHPLAMAGVDQHSGFRADPVGRLRGTVRFVTATTFGSSAAAREVIDLVLRIHTRVHGIAPDGRPYRADDPGLLTWVHTAEVRSFLAGHQAYAPRRLRLNPAECDAYYRQVAPVAEALGARGVPRTSREAERYLARLRPELHATPAALDSVLFLRGFGRTRRERLVVGRLMNASVGLLPGWARAELGIRRPAPVRAGWDRPLATAVGRVLQWGLGPSRIQAAARGRLAGARQE